MGKTTLYHPIPTTAVRGSLAYCGWKVGTIKQIYSDKGRQLATYTARIVSAPRPLGGMGLHKLKTELQKCVPPEVTIVGVIAHFNEGYSFVYQVAIPLPMGMTQEEEEELGQLLS